MGNWYICSEQAQHRARKISLHTEIWWGHFAMFWEQPFRKHPRNWSRSRCESSFGMLYRSSSSIPSTGWRCTLYAPTITLVENNLSIVLYTRVQRSTFSVVLFMNEACFKWKGIFNSQKQPRLGRSKPSRCICSLSPKTLCSQCLGRYCAWLLGFVTLTVQQFSA
jgi:hypothetical protein